MNCEQVEELLSAYLDNMLAPEERRLLTAHLAACSPCSALLADYRRNDILLSHLPRVSPDAALRERIFSSPEYLELMGTFDSGGGSGDIANQQTAPRLPANSPRRDTPGRPHLIALPGGRSTAPTPAATRSLPARPARLRSVGQRIMIATIAAALLLTLGISGLIGMNLLAHHPSTSANGGITPPLGGQPPVSPLSAGMRFVFLRGGTLWSILADSSSKQSDRLTSTGITVAGGWAVAAPLPGRAAGDMLAYIDLQKGFVHTIRSDGQQDTPVNQPLLKAGVQPMSIWDTVTGLTILNSLSWSSDGNTLAFVADPDGTGQTRLYLYSRESGKVNQITLPLKGRVSHPVWSPDGIRLAFEVTGNTATTILDYNTQNHGVLTIASGIGTQATAGDSVLSLDWAPAIDFPEITWSVGTIGHVHSLWLHRVGIDGAAIARQLLTGDYVQAIYSRSGHSGVGSWLMVASVAGRPGDLLRIDVTPGAAPVQLTSNKQISIAVWSPDGTHIAYLDMLSSGIGTLHIVNTTTASDVRISNSVANDPAPAWSADGKQLAYSTGTRVGIVNLAAGNANRFLSIKGAASTLAWSLSDPNQLVVALDDGQQGIFLADTRSTSTTRVDTLGTSGPILWTEIP